MLRNRQHRLKNIDKKSEKMGRLSEIIGMNITKLREAAEWSQADLAAKLGVSFSSVSRWETGDMWVSEKNLDKLALLFGVEVTEFFLKEGESEERSLKDLKTYQPTLREALRVINEQLGAKIVIKEKRNRDK